MILITGASSGIGEACAKMFAAAGRGLILTARRKDRLDRLAADLRKKHGIEAVAIALDVRSRTAVETFAEEHAVLLSRVTVLVNNAGLAKGLSTIQDGDVADWESMIDTNLKGLLYVSRSILPILVARKEGHVVNIGSVAGRWVYPKGNIYCATKRAVSALTETMRLDLNGTGVRVTEISPGMVETEFSQVRLGDAVKAKAVYAGVEPLTPDDIAEAVVWSVARPKRMNVQEMVIYATQQASTLVVDRKG